MLRRSLRFKGKKAFTLIELMVAIGILALIATGLLMTYTSCILLAHSNINLTKAANDAELALEELKRRPYSDIVNETINGLSNLENATADIIVEDDSEGKKEVLVDISWTERGRSRNFKLFTIFYE